MSWHAEEFASPPGTWYVADDDAKLVLGAGKPITKEVAVLAAAAPDLLAACEAALNQLSALDLRAPRR